MIGKILGNRYEILEKIGGGGMSVVYKARCRVLNRFVAIKVLRQELTTDPDFIEKFRQESLSAASLTHPNIVNIYDTGIENDIYYIVMEYVKGETLKNYIKRKGKLSESETVKISRQIAEALKHAHANKIVHRDIKPDNILMTEEGTAKVTDFGIARASTSSTINSASNVIGSVHYFSPEQARGGYVDEKSDIYSLGVVMYEMITGQVPFDADNHISVAMKQIQEKAVPPSEKAGVSPKLEEIIMKCLEKHQSYRFQNINEYLNALKTMGGYSSGSLDHKAEVPDSPTITMSKIDDLPEEEKNVIDIRLIDENSDKAFRSFFGEDQDEAGDGSNKKIKNKKAKKKKDADENSENKDEEGRKKNIKITVLAVVSALAVAVLGGILGFRAIFYVPEVSVPYIVGKSEEEARKMIEELDLVFKVENREYSSEYDEGEVMEQSQEEGTKLKKNYPIEVVISKGKKEIKVPNLVGKYAIDAAAILADMGLQEGTVKDEYSPTAPSGQIISQNPLADTPAELKDKVDFVISKGPKISTVVMPRLVGSSLESAKIKILQNGLTVGQVVEENSDEYEAGIVMNQSVPDGQEVEAGTSIWMTVSIGPLKEEEPENPDPGTSDKSYPLTIALPTDKESVSVVVQRITADGREVIYSKDVKTSEQSIIVNVEGKGTQVFEIYIDNTLYDRAEITFN